MPPFFLTYPVYNPLFTRIPFPCSLISFCRPGILHYSTLTSWTFSLYSIINYYYHWVWLYFAFCVFKLLSWVLVKKGVKKVSTCTYMHVHVYMSTKNRLFSALPLENLLLSVIYCLFFEFKCLQCGLLHPASYTDRGVRHEWNLLHSCLKSHWNQKSRLKIRNHSWNQKSRVKSRNHDEIMKSRTKSWNLECVCFRIFPYIFVHVCVTPPT